MSDPQKIPKWIKTLPFAPVYYPTETEFFDPIAFISKIEQEASSFGICKIIPPLPKPSKKFVLSNLTRSISPTFTTRHQELGTRKARYHKQQVWQSGEFYTLEQFESKAKAFRKVQLGGLKEVTPLLIEALFWKAALEKPIYVEYANDVPGSGFAVYRKRRKKILETISDSPWNLQAIAKAPGSLTRFMMDEVPGVTSPMVYIGMLFSWFAWHVEDHELHSLNFLHMGAPKTWYAVPGEYASAFEEVVRVEGYGGDVDRLEAFTMLGEKTTLLLPEVIVNAGIPCCRLVQNPGEFVVTFPKAYHVGFSHGFNCGEAANFATSQWLKVAKEAAIRRAAMNYLPMLSHQQLLYMLTVSFVSRVPRALLSGVRSSRLSDRKREQREILVKKAFLNDIKNEINLLCSLLQKESTSCAVLWEPDLLPNSCTISYPRSSDVSVGVQGSAVSDDEESNPTCVENDKNACSVDDISSVELLEILDPQDCDLPVGLKIDSGPLACVACGVLGYPFMAIVQPSEIAIQELSSAITKEADQNLEKPSCLPHAVQEIGPVGTCNILWEQENSDPCCKLSPVTSDHITLLKETGAGDDPKLLSDNGLGGNMSITTSLAAEIERSNAIAPVTKPFSETCSVGEPVKPSSCADPKWTSANIFNRPRIFCMQHALEVEELLHSKGGAHVLIICHSDYLKIKAYTPAIAEEVGMGLNIIDVPLENASSSDLNLINISIDDGEHEEHGDDWTSKLGVNLRYCLKLRKQATEKQERLTLALDRAFSDPSFVSDFSTLKWRSRRSRTPYKVVGISVADSHIDTNMEKGDALERNLNTNFPTKVKNLMCRRKPNGLINKHHGGNSRGQTESDSSNDIMIVNGGDDCSPISHGHCLDERVENDSIRGLFPVPVSVAVEGPQIQQNTWFCLDVTRADEVADSLRYESFLPCTRIPVLESSEMFQGLHSHREILTKCKANRSTNPESLPNYLQPEAMSSIVQQEIEASDEINSGHEVSDNADSITEPISHVAVANSQYVKDIKLAQEPNPLCRFGNIFPCSDQTPVPESSFDKNEVHLEVPKPDVPKMESNIFHALKLKGPLHCSLTIADSLALKEKEIPKVTVSVSAEDVPMTESCANYSSMSVEHIINSPTTIDRCQIQQEFVQLDVPIANEQFVDHLSTADGLSLLEKAIPEVNMSTEEASMMQTCVNHSSRFAEDIVDNLTTADEFQVQQECQQPDMPIVKEQLADHLSTAGSLVLMEMEIPEVNVSTEEVPMVQSCVDLLSMSVEHTVDNPTPADQFQMQQDECPQVDVPVENVQLVDTLSTAGSLAGLEKEIPMVNMSTEEVPMMESCVTHFCISDEHIVDNLTTMDICRMQQGFSNVENAGEGESIDHPSKAERGDTDGSQECPSPENNSQSGMNNLHLAESSEGKESDKDKDNHWNKGVCIIQYVRRRTKRKREVQIAEVNNRRDGSIIHTNREGKHVAEGFIRSPCEGLRPRTAHITTPSEKADSIVKMSIKDKFGESYECDIEDCHLKFRRKQDLKLHMQNRCTYTECGKRFRSHKDLMRHRRVHNDERPLKCPWKGCEMSFKWEWARTEHLRIHTGERPYQCTVAGCELTFRYVSAFSRHRRKTGHCVDPIDH